MSLNAKIEGTNLIVTIPMEPTLRPSSSGKTLLVGSTGGFSKTSLEVGGKLVSINLTATVPNN